MEGVKQSNGGGGGGGGGEFALKYTNITEEIINVAAETAFSHKKIIDANSLEAGDMVEFDVVVNWVSGGGQSDPRVRLGGVGGLLLAADHLTDNGMKYFSGKFTVDSATQIQVYSSSVLGTIIGPFAVDLTVANDLVVTSEMPGFGVRETRLLMFAVRIYKHTEVSDIFIEE